MVNYQLFCRLYQNGISDSKCEGLIEMIGGITWVSAVNLNQPLRAVQGNMYQSHRRAPGAAINAMQNI